jgi:hypothetical protein
LLAHGQWFSPGTPASSTTKSGGYDITEILLEVALSTTNQIRSKVIASVCRLILIFIQFVLFLLSIVLSVLLRYAVSDYPFGIIKLFLYILLKVFSS